MSDYIPLNECKKGYLYNIVSRNLTFGIYDGKGGFIGIREKFGSRYLFTEFHWDKDPSCGTVKPIKELGRLPEGIEVTEDLGTVDSKTGRKIIWKEKEYCWFYVDTDEQFKPIIVGGYASSVFNEPLFDYLNKFEKE